MDFGKVIFTSDMDLCKVIFTSDMDFGKSIFTSDMDFCKIVLVSDMDLCKQVLPCFLNFIVKFCTYVVIISTSCPIFIFTFEPLAPIRVFTLSLFFDTFTIYFIHFSLEQSHTRQIYC